MMKESSGGNGRGNFTRRSNMRGSLGSTFNGIRIINRDGCECGTWRRGAAISKRFCRRNFYRAVTCRRCLMMMRSIVGDCSRRRRCFNTIISTMIDKNCRQNSSTISTIRRSNGSSSSTRRMRWRIILSGARIALINLRSR